MIPWSIQDVIAETNIVMFSPHFDDFLFNLGGYALELKEQNQISTKKFHILLLFSRSNYLAGKMAGNKDIGMNRIKLATGRRLLEDMNCLDELLGAHNYRYELFGERECFVRAKSFADSEMEFPHGDYEDFDEEDEQIFARIKDTVRAWAVQADTALVFPLAIKEHIDHFITREAGLRVAKEMGCKARANFYFQEDKPYGGIATLDEMERINHFINANNLQRRIYRQNPEMVIELAFKHYISQVEEVYRKGILQRADQLKDLYGLDYPGDCLYALPRL